MEFYVKISIVLAAYNGEKYLKQQLESFCYQTRFPDELVIVDDCSTDSTPTILKEFQNKAPFKTIILRNTENIGSTKSFEKACKEITGDWVLFSDQDDYWKKDKIEIFTQEISKSDDSIGLIYSDYEIVDENLKPLNTENTWLPDYKNPKIESDSAWIFFLTNQVITGCTMGVKKEIIAAAIPFNCKLHDFWLAWIASLLGKIRFIDKKLICYRQHCGQQVGLGFVDKKDKQEDCLSKYENKALTELRKLDENCIFMEQTYKFIERNEIQLSQDIVECINKRYEYLKTRFECLQKSRYSRFLPLCSLFFHGYYHCWHKHPFNAFKHDLIYPKTKL